MSFSAKVKDELCNFKYTKKPCCADAFLTGVLLFSQVFTEKKIVLSSDCREFLDRTVASLKKLVGIEVSDIVEFTRRGRTLYKIELTGRTVAQLYEAAHAMPLSLDEGALIKKCDRAAFLRGVFCAAGYVAEPEGSYHLEIDAPSEELCALIVDVAAHLSAPLKTASSRGRRTRAYLKNADEIFSFLNMLGASSASLRLMEAKVIKEVRNDINRRVNFETANLMKTASASAEQIEAIERIKNEKGLEFLPEHLRELAKLRLENPDLSLSQLGEQLSPRLSRSGVNHRLKKIVELSKS
ncbi:MAG: DNA-binding protein WhiA [Clostridia bacterium]|nr:DNA-binding protein WhiA [Clostridia bacterium]